MSKGKFFMMMLAISVALVLLLPNSSAWPSDDQGGPYYTMTPSETPQIDGVIDGDEWFTEEEIFQETYDQNLVYPNGETVSGLTLSIVMLMDDDNLYVKVTWENQITSMDQPNSIGLAFATSDPGAMAQTYDRKVAYWDGSDINNTDLFNCRNVNTDFCLTNANYLQPGVPDTNTEFTAAFGVDTNNRGFFEFQIPRSITNGTEDLEIGVGTYIEIVANPFDNIAANNIGHAGGFSQPLFIQDTERCFFCQPGEGMDTNARIFNIFFALIITGIFLTLIFSGRSEAFAAKLWKVDVSEDMAKESVIMEMAYYNSSFIGILVSAFFLMYSLIGLIYGIWAQWGLIGAFTYGIPTLLGVFTIVDLVGRNQNPQEFEGEKLGVDVSEANNFWLVPTLFLAITLLMLVFIGIDVIA